MKEIISTRSALLILSAFALCLPAAAATKGGALNLIFLGDSITYGGMLPSRDTQSPPVICAAEMRKHLSGRPVFMANEGHSGHTTVDFLPSTGTDFPLALKRGKDMLAGNGGSLVFSIMLGTNDSAESGTNGAPVSPESYATNLRSLITGLQQEFPDAYFVLHEPLWYSPNTANGAEYGTRGLARLQSYFAQLPLVAASFPNHVYLGDTQAYGLLEAHAKDDLTPEQGRRGIFYLHPNPQGARLLGHQWAKALLATLK